MPKYLDNNGVLYFWQKCKAAFAAISHTHSASDITSGVLGVGQGGTGVDGSTVAINKVFAGPSSGSAGVAEFRSLVEADIPSIAASKISGTLGVNHGGTGVSTLGAGVVYHSANGTGALSIATGTNLVSAIGSNAVARATADASGNNIADTYAKKNDVTNMYKYKGSVATESQLPTTGQTNGDVYNIEAASTYGSAGTNVAWTGTEWDSLGGETFSLESITNSEIDTIVAA